MNNDDITTHDDAPDTEPTADPRESIIARLNAALEEALAELDLDLAA